MFSHSQNKHHNYHLCIFHGFPIVQSPFHVISIHNSTPSSKNHYKRTRHCFQPMQFNISHYFSISSGGYGKRPFYYKAKLKILSVSTAKHSTLLQPKLTTKIYRLIYCNINPTHRPLNLLIKTSPIPSCPASTSLHLNYATITYPSGTFLQYIQ